VTDFVLHTLRAGLAAMLRWPCELIFNDVDRKLVFRITRRLLLLDSRQPALTGISSLRAQNNFTASLAAIDRPS